MSERIDQELTLLRRYFSDLEYREDGGWVLLPRHPLSSTLWNRAECAIAFQIPQGYPGNKPYAFYAQPVLELKSGASVDRSTVSQEPPFGGQWLKFSWEMLEWRPTADLQSGSNLLNFVLTFKDRLEQGA